METPGEAPTPWSGMDWGLPAALSVIATAPVRAPEAVGVKVTPIVQLAPAARLEAQVPPSRAKSPLVVTDEMVSEAVPVFVSVNVDVGLVDPTAWLGKVRLDGATETSGPAPVPVSVTVWGLVVALSAIETEPVRVPWAVGRKTTPMVQFRRDLSDDPQDPPLRAKSPVKVTLEMLNVPAAVFESVMVLAALVVPIACAPKVRLVGETDAVTADAGDASSALMNPTAARTTELRARRDPPRGMAAPGVAATKRMSRLPMCSR